MATTHPVEKWEGIDKAIESCIGVSGNRAFDGSYAAPREAFRKILNKLENALEEKHATQCYDNEVKTRTAILKEIIEKVKYMPVLKMDMETEMVLTEKIVNLLLEMLPQGE